MANDAEFNQFTAGDKEVTAGIFESTPQLFDLFFPFCLQCLRCAVWHQIHIRRTDERLQRDASGHAHPGERTADRAGFIHY